jgi:hypothetical protein
MILSLLAFVGSFIGLVGGAGLFAALIGFGFFLGWNKNAIWIVAVVAAAYLSTSLIYRAGKAECEQATKSAVAVAEARWAGVTSVTKAMTARDLDAVTADRDAAEADLTALAKSRPAGKCALTQEEADEVNGK